MRSRALVATGSALLFASATVLYACDGFEAAPSPDPADGSVEASTGTDDAGPGAIDASTADGSVDATTLPPRCNNPKTPTSLGLYNPLTAEFTLYGPDRSPTVVRRFVPRAIPRDAAAPEDRVLPVAGAWNGVQAVVALYSSDNQMLYRFQENASDAGYTTPLAIGNDNVFYRPFSGDWNGDAKSQLGLFRSSSSDIVLEGPVRLADGGTSEDGFNIGILPRDQKPFAGDFEGHGSFGIGLYRPATGDLTFTNAPARGATTVTFTTNHSGLAIWPVTGDWDGCGPDRIGLWDDTKRTFYLFQENSQDAIEEAFPVGDIGVGRRFPVAGRW